MVVADQNTQQTSVGEQDTRSADQAQALGSLRLMPLYGPCSAVNDQEAPQIGHDPVSVDEGHLRSRGPSGP